MVRFATISDLTNPEKLCTLTGPISKVSKTLLSAIGFSASVLERIEIILQSGIKRNFILKRTRLGADWLSQRSNDQVGREAALLNEFSLSGIWNIIHCPYSAFTSENDQIGLLMDDFTDYLFPDVREPIELKSEDQILKTIASLHGSFWESTEVKKTKWLLFPHNY